MKSDHRSERSAIFEPQRCGLEQVCMIAATNVQTYFCLLLASGIGKGAAKGRPDIYIVTIVFFEAEERMA